MKEWYLTDNYKPTVTSGYESDAISEFAESNFTDVLETAFSDAVLLYNHDLSECKEVRCIIQGNSSDTKLSSMKRSALFPIGTIKTGMYVYYNDSYWIVTGYPGNNKSYEKVSLNICQYKLRWQNRNGDIIERWANFTSASKYNDGLQETTSIILSSDNLSIILPCDAEAMDLEYKRVFIDNRPIPKKVYTISRSDDVLYDFGNHGGILNLIADKTEFDESRDNCNLGICDYIEPDHTDDENPNEFHSDIHCKITGNSKLKVGFEKDYVATLTDNYGKDIEWTEEYEWVLENAPCVSSSCNENKITIIATDEDFVGDSIVLQVVKSGNLVGQFEIVLTGAF